MAEKLTNLKRLLGEGTLLPEALKDIIIDYPIEKGSNENGTWEKWASGKLVQRSTISLSLDNDSLKQKEFPIPFANNIINVSFNCNQNAVLTKDYGTLEAYSSMVITVDTNKWSLRQNVKSTSDRIFTIILKAEGTWE